jgi:uncharacterized membrane protein
MKSPQVPFPDDLDADPGSSLDRIISLMDGIFAFAMTLLAINVDIPRLAQEATAQQVTEAVINLAPEVLIFVTSFLLVATYWNVNRRMFTLITKSDGLLVWLVILQMVFVAFLPVATGLIDTYPNVPIVVVIYAGTLLAVGVVGQLMFSHARRAGLVDRDVNPILADYYAFRGNFTILIYVMVLLAGLTIAEFARWLLILLVLGYPFLKHAFRFWYQFKHKDSGA